MNSVNYPQSPKVYFVTLHVFRHIDFFSNDEYASLFLECLRLYQDEYGLLIFDWSILTNSVQLIASSQQIPFKTLINDLKKFTTIQLLDAIKFNSSDQRREWLLSMFETDIGEERFWKGGFHSRIIHTRSYYSYIQQVMYYNLVNTGLASNEESYIFSSCASRLDKKEGQLELSTFFVQDANNLIT